MKHNATKVCKFCTHFKPWLYMEVKNLDSYSGYLCPVSHRIFICLFIYLCVIYSDSVRHSDCIASTGMMMNCQKLHTTQIIVLNSSKANLDDYSCWNPTLFRDHIVSDMHISFCFYKRNTFTVLRNLFSSLSSDTLFYISVIFLSLSLGLRIK